MTPHTEQLIDKLRQWAEKAEIDKPMEAPELAELDNLIIRAIYNLDHNPIEEFRDGLSPIAALLRSFLKTVPLAARQAVGISMWARILRGIAFIIEKDDPIQAVELIKNGATVLEVLIRINNPQVTIAEIKSHWLNNPPSEATISRVLGALEEAGFVQREGATKGRRIHLLPKAHHWVELTRPKSTPKFSLVSRTETTDSEESPKSLSKLDMLIYSREVPSLHNEAFLIELGKG